MARRSRRDFPGSYHHVMNRAVARRTLFETTADIRFFLACVARAVRRGEIEVHAWCILTTHFHLLVRSLKGELAAAMRRIQNEYVRYFNRTRRRDGPLVRGRFVSRPVESLRYRIVLVVYIDNNPVRAGLCDDPCDYAFGSARQYVSGKAAKWLTRTWVESWVAERAGADEFDPADYPRSLDPKAQRRNASVVAARIRASGTLPSAARDELDSLLGMATPATLAWLRRKAKLADGTAIGQTYVAPAAVTEAIERFRKRHGPWRFGTGRRTVSGWDVLHVGLLRDLAGARFASIAARLHMPQTTTRRFGERHRRLLEDDAVYGERAAAIVREALESGATVP